MTLGQRIKKLRTDECLTQKDLADKIHVMPQTVSKWENDENEPDVATLKELSRIFNCSLDTLLDYAESNEEIASTEQIIENKEPEQEKPAEQTTVIIHQTELHVCEVCKKDIQPNDLDMEQVIVHHSSRGRPAAYRTAYYHKECLAKKKKDEYEAKIRARKYHANSARKKCFGWGIAAGVLALIIAILVFTLSVYADNLTGQNVALSILFSIIAGICIFAMIYCILSGSYIGDVFVWCASLSIKFPGLIFSWDIDGIIWVICMKVLFAIIAFFVGVFAFLFAIAFSATLSIFSFPFILIHNIKTDYEDAF